MNIIINETTIEKLSPIFLSYVCEIEKMMTNLTQSSNIDGVTYKIMSNQDIRRWLNVFMSTV